MKKTLLVLVMLFTCINLFAAPRVSIVVQNVTPYDLKVNSVLVPDSSITTGMKVTGNNMFVYLRAFNFGDTAAITNSTWTFISKPAGSTATFSTVAGLNWGRFKADVKGVYEINVHIVTSTGTKDTTKKIVAADFVGTGGFDGVPAVYPNCMSGCHSFTPKFVDIFNRWKVSGHATRFKYQIDSGSASYSISCIKCHTTGYDHNKFGINNGFDDKARDLGWSWSNWSPPKKGNWDSLKNKYPSLVAFASIGCESCHGPGSEHTLSSGDSTRKLDMSITSGKCGQCHDSPTNHNIYSMWKNALHSHPVMEGRVVADSVRNTLNDCNRCHDGEAYVGYTKGVKSVLNLTTADQEVVGCATCHDPHGSANEYQLRSEQPNADTLATGYHYSAAGNGKVCLSCHHARRSNLTYVTIKGSFSSTWGPHENPQGDIVLGKNAASFGIPYISGSHSSVPNLCVTCHMAATTDTGTVTRDKVGGHSLNMNYAATNYDHTTGCNGCHPGKTSFDQFVAPEDYDGDGTIEPWQAEVSGLLKKVAWKLPHNADSTINWQVIARDSLNLNLRKAYWNYLMFKNDKSMGMHNPFFAVNVLLTSYNYAIGVENIGTEIPFTFDISQNYPNPFNPSTKIDFAVARGTNVAIRIYDITGREIKTLINQFMPAGKYKVTWEGDDNVSSKVTTGVYFYRITANNFVMTKKMVLVK